MRVHRTLGAAILGAGGDDSQSGGKGDSGASRTPIETPETLRSVAHARIVDLICEGEVVGLENGLKSVFFDGVPVQNGDGSYNFKDVTVYDVKGLQNQEFIPGFAAAESEVSVATQATLSTPVVRSISASASADAVRVTVQIPALSLADPATGNLGASAVQIRIDLQNNGGGYVSQPLSGADWFRGLCTNPFERSFRVELPGPGPWDVKLVRLSADSAGPNSNQTWFKSYTVITDGKLSYPNSALCAVEVNAHQFSSIPVRSYLMKGLKVKVPTNYDPASRTFGGVWDGTFQTFWSDNPAWCFYDLLTNTRYGLGKYVDAASVDKWTLNDIAKYCDAGVDRGDRYLDGTKTPYGSASAEQDMTSIDNGDGTYEIVIGGTYGWPDYGFVVGMEVNFDQFSSPGVNGFSGNGIVTAIFDESAVQDGMTIKATDGQTALPAGLDGGFPGMVATATNRTEPRFRLNLYLQTQEDAYRVVNNLASVFRGMTYWATGTVFASQDAPKDPTYAFNQTNVEDGVFTYTSSGRRARHSSAVVSWNDPENHYREAKELVTDEATFAKYGYNPVEVVALGCSSRGQAVRVGKWMLYSERYENEVVTFKTGLEGALVDPGEVVVVHDSFRAGKRFGGRVVSWDPATSTVELDQEVTLDLYDNKITFVNTLGTTSVVNVAGSGVTKKRFVLSPPPLIDRDSLWVAQDSSLVPVQYRVVSATEVEEGKYEVTALRYEPGKFGAVEGDVAIQSLPTTVLPSSNAPAGLVLGETLLAATTGLQSFLTARWTQNVSATAYRVRWKKGNGNWSEATEIKAQYWELPDVKPASYTVQVSSIVSGLETMYAEATYSLTGKTAPPSDVAGFAFLAGPISATCSWTHIADPDWDFYEIRSGGSGWSTADLVAKVRATKYEYQYTVTTGSETLRIKAVDTSGNYSTNASSFTITVTNAFGGGDLTPGVGQSDGSHVWIIAKGHVQGTARDGDGVSFPSGSFQSIPLVVIDGGISYQPDSSKWTGATYSASKPQYKQFVPLNITAGGFDMQCRLRQKSTINAQTEDAASSSNSLTSIGDAASATLSNAGASGSANGQYTCRYKCSIHIKGIRSIDTSPGATVTTVGTLVLALDSSADGGTTWVERGTYTYVFSTTSLTYVTQSWNAEIKTISVSGLASTSPADKIRLRVKDFYQDGNDQWAGDFAAHFFHHTPDTYYAVNYSTASGDGVASATPDAEDYVTWNAMSTQG